MKKRTHAPTHTHCENKGQSESEKKKRSRGAEREMTHQTINQQPMDFITDLSAQHDLYLLASAKYE